MTTLTEFRDHCEAPSCVRPIKARGLCSGHYTRLIKHGTIGTRPLLDRAPKARGAGTLAERLRTLGPVSESGCWVWIGYTHDGYGYLTVNGQNRRAHRVSYETFIGPVPDGLVLDHLCRNRACINPEHLQAVTSAVNNVRGFGPSALNVRKTHCIHGHRFSEENTYITPSGSRHCRTCGNLASNAYKARRRSS